MIKRLFKLIIIFLLIVGVSYSQEVISSYDENTISVLNEELRSMRKTINSFENGITISLIANQNVNIGDVCYINSSGKAALIDADAIATMSGVAIAMDSISSGVSGKFLLFGIIEKQSWNWTVGGLIYGSTTGTTGNTLTQTAPTGTNDVTQVMGVALSSNKILFNPNLAQAEHL